MNREQQVGDIARRLKNIAKETGITVVLLSQLSRDKLRPRPSLPRLRDSGQIEEAADQVIFVYRPEFYGIEYFNEPFEMTQTKGKAEIIIAKGRNIGITAFIVNFDFEHTEFTDYDSFEANPVQLESPCKMKCEF